MAALHNILHPNTQMYTIYIHLPTTGPVPQLTTKSNMKGFFSKINPCPFEVFSSLLGLNESQMSNTAAIPSLASTITLETEVRLGVTLKRPYRTVCMCVWETWEVGEIVVRGKTWDIRRGWSADRCVCLPICFSHC